MCYWYHCRPKTHFFKITDSSTPRDEGKWTLKTLLIFFQWTLEGMPSVLKGFKVALSVYNAELYFHYEKCVQQAKKEKKKQATPSESSYNSTCFERDLTKKRKAEWKESL